MINWNIAGNPLNWLIVLTMAYIAFFGVIISSQYINTKRNG